MNSKIKIELGSVQKTLLLPLWGRAVETRKENPMLVDNTAAEIIDKIDYDFSTITANTSFVTQLAWIARSIHIDDTVKKFLSNYPDAAVVNIGCGLDTTYERVNNGKLFWYDLDLPDVISLRKIFMTETVNRRFISSSALNEDWINQIKSKDRVFLIAAGVIYYFDEEQAKKFFNMIADNFIYAEMIFDAVTPLGVKAANQSVIKETGMDASAVLKWGIKSAGVLETWNPKIKLIKEYPLFKGVKKGYSFKEKYGMFLSDLLKIMYMVHLEFEKR
ncbi:MAG TPA: class I SAM-dependent methyltransferase [Ignavibacteriaceae bacterium]|nr:class I SAM-dependent methyltransferase [Ignavibacteriaceae bacterium]